MNAKKTLQSTLAVLFLVCFGFGMAFADDYPSKPITMIIPLGAGGSHDLNARVFTSVIPTYLNQAIIIKLMPGAGGQTGTAAAVRAKPDGYTLIFTHNFIDQLQPQVEKLPYDTTKAFVTVWRLNYGTPIVYGLSSRPWKTLKEMMDDGKKNPGKLVFGHSGKWGATFTPMSVILAKDGVSANYIPYKGGGPALAGTLAGDVDFTVGFPAQGLPHYQSGKLRFYAVGSENRLKACPEVPTLKELGYPVKSMFMSRIVLAPRNTPQDRIDKLREAFKKLYADKTFKSLMAKLGENLDYMDGPDYEKVRASQKGEYKALVKSITGQ